MGIDVLADFLKESQAQRYQLQKNKIDFHNIMGNEKGWRRGASRGTASTGQLKTPQALVRETLFTPPARQTPHHMRFQANAANHTIQQDRQNQQAKAGSAFRDRDISYRTDAKITIDNKLYNKAIP